MSKEYTCLGMMSGTSGDGVDASIIYSNGLYKLSILKENILSMTINYLESFTT